ncbi:MAG: tol-pal system-associated acyl-CoA thioesterase [Gammaproteobacteria bacterium]
MPTFYWPIRVYYEDTDASRVVYHAAYVKYFERARTEWLRALGFSQDALHDELGVVFTVANLELDFLRPARLDDELQVAVEVEQARRASLTFRQELHRKGEGGTPLARARVRVGCVDVQNFRPCAMPEAFINHLEQKKGTA